MHVAARRRDAVAVTHAVIAGEVGRGFGRGDDIISGQGVFRVRQRDRDDLGALGFQPGNTLIPKRGDFGIHAVEPIFGRDADALALHAARQAGSVIRNRDIEAGRILGIEPAHGGEHERTIGDSACHRPGLIERGGKGDRAPTRSPAIGWLDAGDADECGGLADRAAGIGAGGAGTQPRRNGCRRTAGRTAWHQFSV